MLLAEYGSDSDSGSDNESGPSRPSASAAKPAVVPPTSVASGSKPKRKAPVKITLDLPKSSTVGSGSRDEDDAGPAGSPDGTEGEPDSKRAKTGGIKGGKGSSSLLGMLPAPKRKLPASKGGSGSGIAVTKSLPKPIIAVPKPAANLPAPPGHAEDDSDDDDDDGPSGGMLLPPSLQRGKAKAAKGKESSLDLFGLSSEPDASSSKSKASALAPPAMSISSAPTVADFVPPEPTAEDPYPGYYQLPSGQWAAHDPEYYHRFFPDTSIGDEEGDDGRVGRHWEEFNSKGADFIDIDVSKGLAEARAEKERRERMVKPKLPSDEVQYKAIGQIKGLATERHQLSSLLNTAFTQKEELENRIASNKKNMRHAAQKYGF